MTAVRRTTGRFAESSGNEQTTDLRVPALLLERLYRIANGDLHHTYFAAYNGGRKHSIACDHCDTLAEIRKVLG